MTSSATLTESTAPPAATVPPAATAPSRRRRRLPTWMWGAIGAALVLIYAIAVERMRLGPPLVMLALGGMTLAFTASALWRMIDPLSRETPPGDPAAGQSRGFVRELEREKQLVLKAIKEIELDYQMRKISERDYREMVERYRNRAMRLISELDAGGDYRGLIEKELKLRLELPVADTSLMQAPSAATASAAATTAAARPQCAACQTENDPDAKFCKSCGGKL
jgi:predicted membrane metal-binding protein